MNQHDQMREALRLADAVIKSWIPVSYNREKINERAHALKAIEQALNHTPDTGKPKQKCPICEGQAVRQMSYHCHGCGADYADHTCTKYNIEQMHGNQNGEITDSNHTPDTSKMVHVNETPKNEHDSDDVLRPAPLVRLTLSEKLAAIEKAQQKTLPETINRYHALEVANAIMDAMERVNRGSL